MWTRRVPGTTNIGSFGYCSCSCQVPDVQLATEATDLPKNDSQRSELVQADLMSDRMTVDANAKAIGRLEAANLSGDL